MNVRTRFAPSPTGYLHVGSLRTALYSFLYARKQNGKFILRIEDTDRERYVEGSVEALIRTLEKVGITYDEGPVLHDGKLEEEGDRGPYTQSHRLDIYKKFAQDLVDKGAAYHCFCSKERLSNLRDQQTLAKLPTKYDRHCLSLTKEEVQQKLQVGEPRVVRLMIPEGETSFHDEIHGTITIKNTEIDDQVLIKTDGFPTYHLAVVVDDHLMGVTHIIRGDEWISSVPKHIILYEKLGFPLPVYAHLPLILNPDKSKLSKRQGDVAAEDYLKKGYLPATLINFVALLGFNPSGDREIYSVEELIQAFDLSKINKGGAVFDIAKLNWMNSQYIKNTETEILYSLAENFFGEATTVSDAMKKRILEVEKSRLVTLQDLSEHVLTYIKLSDYGADDLIWKKSDREDAKLHLNNIRQLISHLDDDIFHDQKLIEDALKRYIEDNGFQNGNVLWPTRVALSGQRNSSGPFELIWVLGKTESLSRIDRAIEKLSA